MLVGGTWKMAPAKRPDKVLLFFPWGIMDGGLFITHSVTLSNTNKICSLWRTQTHSGWAGQELEQIFQADAWVMKCNVYAYQVFWFMVSCITRLRYMLSTRLHMSTCSSRSDFSSLAASRRKTLEELVMKTCKEKEIVGEILIIHKLNSTGLNLTKTISFQLPV